MPQNNNNSSKSSMMTSLTFGKGKHGLATVVLVLILIGSCIAYYYMYKSNHMYERNNDSFVSDSSSSSSSSDINLIPGSNECVFALFYAPWCGHCKTFKPEFKKAMDSMNGKMSKGVDTKGKNIRFVMIDCDELPELGKKYGINGYPTIKILGDSGKEIAEYSGERSFKGINDYLVIDN